MEEHTEKAKLLANKLEDLIMSFKSVDDRCLSLSENLSSRELLVVSFVGGQEKVIMKDIADLLNAPMSTATGIVDKLVRKQFLQRNHSKEDRRTVNIHLDVEGRAIYDLYNSLKFQMTGQVLNILSKSETDDFIHLIEKIMIGLKSYEVVDVA